MHPISSEELIQSLSHGLAPVRPVPRLRTACAMVVGLALPGLAVIALIHPPRVDLASAVVGSFLYPTVLGGLLVAAVAGVAAGLAAGVPGREPVFQRGAVLALAGIGAATGACVLGVLAQGNLTDSVRAPDVNCLLSTLALSALPAAGLLLGIRRAWVQQPRNATALGLLGSVAIGALIVHLYCCPAADGRHLLLGHSGPPLAVAVAGALPLASLVTRRRRR